MLPPHVSNKGFFFKLGFQLSVLALIFACYVCLSKHKMHPSFYLGICFNLSQPVAYIQFRYLHSIKSSCYHQLQLFWVNTWKRHEPKYLYIQFYHQVHWLCLYMYERSREDVMRFTILQTLLFNLCIYVDASINSEPDDEK